MLLTSKRNIVRYNIISKIIYLFLALFFIGCTIKMTKSTNNNVLDFYKKIVNESSKPIVYSTLWYYCTYHQWPEDKTDLKIFLSKNDSTIDLSRYSMIDIQKNENGNLTCTYTIEGQKGKLSVDINFKDFEKGNFDCATFPPHKPANDIIHI